MDHQPKSMVGGCPRRRVPRPLLVLHLRRIRVEFEQFE